MKIGVVIFPGSNCDYDAYQAFKLIGGTEVKYLWHGRSSLDDSDMVVLPGGFAHGDYLRCGAIARFSPIMKAVLDFAREGGQVLGICNGFQVLLEAGLLPGALIRNSGLRFACRQITLRVENNQNSFTARLNIGDLMAMPVAHGDGNYFADPATLAQLETDGRIVFRYADRNGVVTWDSNPNGSANGIAGICNERGNVLGMMPHPERACEAILGSADGLRLLESLCSN